MTKPALLVQQTDWPAIFGILLLLPPCHWDHRKAHYACFFTWVLGIQTQVLTVVHEALPHLPTPRYVTTFQTIFLPSFHLVLPYIGTRKNSATVTQALSYNPGECYKKRRQQGSANGRLYRFRVTKVHILKNCCGLNLNFAP